MNFTWAMLSSAAIAFAVDVQTPPASTGRAKITLDSHGEPHFVEPPGEPVGEIAELLSRAKRALEGGVVAADVLADPSLAPLRPYSPFRELVRQHAKSSKSSLIPPGEPGTPLTVIARVLDSEGQPVPDALVYAYQTSSKGWYAAEAPHVSGASGDVKHARLFAYLRSAADGSFELATVRPGGYPRSTLPQHIHLAIESGAGRLGTEIVFEDDPRLTPEAREEARRSRFVFVTTEKRSDGSERCAAEFRLSRR